VALQLELPEDLPAVEGDRALLVQMFNSLVANAMESMRSGGELRVEARIERGKPTVDISDTGHGISPEQLGHVFRPYMTGKSKGLGLGLPLARRIAERHRGRIKLSSEQGVGTTAQVRLRIAEA
jgi:signal transduction histidine kinase